MLEFTFYFAFYCSLQIEGKNKLGCQCLYMCEEECNAVVGEVSHSPPETLPSVTALAAGLKCPQMVEVELKIHRW